MLGDEKNIDRYYRGKIITAADLNKLLDRLERLEKLRGDQSIDTYGPEGGLSVTKFIVPIKRFRLYTPLSVGGTAEAYSVGLDTNGVLQQSTTADLRVKDVYGEHFGAALDYGEGRYLSDSSNHLEVIHIAHIAREIKFRLVESLTRFTQSAEAIVTQWSHGYKPTANVDVYNMEWTADDIYEFSGSIDSVGYAKYNEILGIYNIWQIQCDSPVESSASL